MGQAKRKGSLQERKKLAMLRERAKFPESLKCDTCKKDVFDLVPLDSKVFEGGEGVCFGLCSSCNSVVLGISTDLQDIDNVKKIQDFFMYSDQRELTSVLEAIKEEYLQTIEKHSEQKY